MQETPRNYAVNPCPAPAMPHYSTTHLLACWLLAAGLSLQVCRLQWRSVAHIKDTVMAAGMLQRLKID